MPVYYAMKMLRIAAVPMLSIIIGVPAALSARAQATPAAPAAPAAPPVPLKTYTLPDKSASAGVPAGWTVKGGGTGMIVMTGTQGENITLGQIILAHDGPFQVGQKGPDGAVITMPSSAKLSDKLLMIYQQNAASSGESTPQMKFIYGNLLQVPSAMGQCGDFVVTKNSGKADAAAAMGVFCSLPDDSGQFFKNVLLMGSAPAAVAAQTQPIVLAVFKSYALAPGWSQKIFAPFMSAPAGGSGISMPGVGATYADFVLPQPGFDPGFDCTDAGLVGPSNLRTAVECGYLSPDF
jgi:hypothetical protein